MESHQGVLSRGKTTNKQNHWLLAFYLIVWISNWEYELCLLHHFSHDQNNARRTLDIWWVFIKCYWVKTQLVEQKNETQVLILKSVTHVNIKRLETRDSSVIATMKPLKIIKFWVNPLDWKHTAILLKTKYKSKLQKKYMYSLSTNQ